MRTSGRLYDNIVDTVGGTPLVKLNRITAGIQATIAIKCEYFNALGSVKDRIGKSMIEAAEREGIINKDTTIVEPTSGNTGIALAFVCAAKGYNLILTMPETMSMERRTLLAMLGAKFPQAQFLITGVLGPHSNAHGPNEFLHIGYAKKLTACVADVIASFK